MEEVPELSAEDLRGTFTPLKLDLYNFEEPQFEDSKYILTSPRSLEACSRLSLKPVDLLYKPLAEFQDELLPNDIPLRAIYNIYDEHEQKRLRKLQLCRDERNRIIINEDKTQIELKKRISHPDETKGSMQRKRTAWATSVGHRRLTNDEVNERAKELHDESLKLRAELLSRKEGKLAKRTAKKRSWIKPARNQTASFLLARDRSSRVANQSFCSAQSVGSSSRGSKHLKTSSVRIPEKDKKIVELMKAKREEEQLVNQQREMAKLMWDDEKKMEQSLREEAETRRRKLLAEENRIKSQKKEEKDNRRKKSEKEAVLEKSKSIDNSEKQWKSSFLRQLQMRELKLAEKRDKEQLRKCLQEQNLKLQENDEVQMHTAIQQKVQSDLRQANMRKEAKIHEESIRKILSNRQRRELFENRLIYLDRQNRQDIETLRSSIDMKHNSARASYKHVLQQRERDLYTSHCEREKKLQQAKVCQKKMDEDMESWREDLLKQRKKVEEQALETAVRMNELKAQKAHEDRIAREKEQKINIKKVQQELERWRLQLEESLEVKDRKTQLAQQEKESLIMQTRAMAQASQKLRDDVRSMYASETFDKKALQAEMYAKMENKVRPSSVRTG